jgi:hypothetical protein
MATLVLNSLTCVQKTGDAGSNDEVYINISTEGLSGKLPSNEDYWEMSDGQTQALGNTYEFTGTFSLTLMESDAGNDDELGAFTFDTSIAPPGSPLEFTGEGGDYELNFSYTA